MTNGKRNRSAGHSWERKIVEVLRKIGFPHAVTSRSESKSRDDQKVDIINKDEFKNGRLPYNIQAKNTSGTLKYAVVLSEQPKEDGVINVIFHKQTEKQGERFVCRDKFAILYLDDFLKLIKERNDRSSTGPKLVPKAARRTPKRVHAAVAGEAQAGIPQSQGMPGTV